MNETYGQHLIIGGSCAKIAKREKSEGPFRRREKVCSKVHSRVRSRVYVRVQVKLWNELWNGLLNVLCSSRL